MNWESAQTALPLESPLVRCQPWGHKLFKKTKRKGGFDVERERVRGVKLVFI